MPARWVRAAAAGDVDGGRSLGVTVEGDDVLVGFPEQPEEARP